MTEEELQVAIDASAVEHLGAGAAVKDLTPLGGGANRELWAFDAVTAQSREPLVLRRPPVEAGTAATMSGADEWEVLVAAHRKGVPVPEPRWRMPDGGMVMERVEGEAIPRRILRDDDLVAARGALPAQLGAAAAAIHAIPLSEVPSVSVPEGPPAEAAVTALEAELDRIGEPHPALELGLRWLRRNLPNRVEPGLVHGDLRLGNFLVGPHGLAAVLDWELVHAGDPAEDLGWLCIRSWRFGHDELPVAGCGPREALLEAYAAAGGREVSRDELFFWEVYGNVRWGVICLVQADVHLSGAQRSLERAAIGRRTCEPEWDLLAMIGA